MRNFTLITALLLCSLSWMSVSASESHTVEVQSGADVTLMCSNISSVTSTTEWFRVINRKKPSCVSSMNPYDSNSSFCDGFQNGFEMSSNISTVFLKIKRVDLSDSGLYFCGIYIGRHTVIVNATYLKVQAESDGTATLMILILGALTVLLLMVIIGLVVKIMKLQKAANEEQNPQQPENRASEELNYAAVAFHPKTRKTREVEPNVVYASTR
ncbi:uncharacterized protein LOC120572399 [Perca fluviatilis]|uniref:uncharacterized protein LOC120572399 n=1 Tax=Perca fluviatilis TaxID=8168 RepID=UPI0019653ABE|nr:uncharacterized protein LOC120572399 [Perca fluviatilis]